MKVSYDRFFKLLIDKKMKKGELCKRAGISTNNIARMAKGMNLNIDILARICGVLGCTMDDILELIPDDAHTGSIE
jgi:DNA-binding Xre family transcriptional regulator